MKAQTEDQSNVKPIKEVLVSAQEEATRKLHELETKATLVASRAQVRFLKASGTAREIIHRRPLTTVLAGFGAGVLIGGLATALLAGGRNSKTSGQSNIPMM